MRRLQTLSKLDMHSNRQDRTRALASSAVSNTLEREPWRGLRASLAVQFALRPRSSRSRNDLSAEIQFAMEARHSIRKSHNDIRSALFDLTRPYRRLASLTDTARNELQRTRQLVAAGGPFSAWHQPLVRLVKELQSSEVLTRGFVRVIESRSGRIHFRFELGRIRRILTCDDLRMEEDRCRGLAREATRLIATISHTVDEPSP